MRKAKMSGLALSPLPRPSPQVKTSGEKGGYVRTGAKPGRKPKSPYRKAQA